MVLANMFCGMKSLIVSVCVSREEDNEILSSLRQHFASNEPLHTVIDTLAYKLNKSIPVVFARVQCLEKILASRQGSQEDDS